MSLFYSEAILSRRGPLARVWLAAHYERKLSRALTLQTDIEQSVGAYLLFYQHSKTRYITRIPTCFIRV